MSVIKNIAELNGKEWEEFLKFYSAYFRNFSLSKMREPHLNKIDTFLRARRCALIELSRIKEGFTTGFVSYDFDFESERDTVSRKPNGFMIGYDTGEGTNNLSHFFVTRETESYPRTDVIRDLLAAYIQVAKSNGSFYIQTSSSIFDSRLSADLDALEFARTCTIGTEEVYNKSI